MFVSLTIDMDNYQDYHSLVANPGHGSPEAGASFYFATIPRFLDIFDRHGMKATFFMVGRDGAVAEHKPLIREIAARGHEVGNHSYSHTYNFRKLDRAAKIAEIEQGDAAIADILGERPVGFRTPSCDVDCETHELLKERGYLYDSSVFPTPLMYAFMLYGKLFVRRANYQLGTLAAALGPPQPYLPRTDKLHRRLAAGASRAPHLVEIPISVLPGIRVPYYSTLLRMFGGKPFDWLVSAYPKRRFFLQMLFHLIDLADLEDSSLGQALAKTPGLDVPLARRQHFVDAAVERLSRRAKPATLREVAQAYLEDCGLTA